MSPVSRLGVNPNSGVYNLVQQYMVAERVQLNRLQETKDEERSHQRAFTDLSAKLSSLRSVANDFRWGDTLSPINTFTTASTDPTVVTITAGSNAADGPHAVTVSTLAAAHSVVSTEFEGAATTAWAGTHTFQLEQDGVIHEITVTTDAEDTNAQAMRKVVTAINDGDADVTATLAVTDALSGGTRLLITSRSSGTTSLISEMADTSGTRAATLGLAGGSSIGNYASNTVQEAADASFTIDGLAFVSAENRVEDALTGITIDLVGVSSDPVAVTIERDVEAVTASVQGLLDAYNALNTYVRDQTRGASSDGTGRGQLTGDTMFMTLRTQLRSSATAEVPDLSGQGRLARLVEIGITADRQGLLTLSDTTAFEDALVTRSAEVERLFTDSEAGIGRELITLLDRYVGAGGLLASQRTISQTRMRAIDNRIEREELHLVRREEQLTQELASLQATLAALQQQQQYMRAIGLM